MGFDIPRLRRESAVSGDKARVRAVWVIFAANKKRTEPQ